MKINVVISLFLVIIFCDSKVFSQQKSILNYQNTPLDEVLYSLENIYEVKFSFISEITEDKNVKIIGELLLEDVLQKIQSQTSLFFEKIDKRFYIIRDKSISKNQICIQLLDRETIAPLEGAVLWKKITGGTVTSDDQGYSYLHLKQHEKDTIRIRFLGYQDAEYAISDLRGEKCTKIYLHQRNNELEEVLIQEYVTRGFSREKLSGSVVLDPSKLGLLPRLIEPDILKSIQFLPGIESSTEKASELFIRGSNSDQNLILWDGIKIYNSGHFFNLLSAFNPYVTESVKVSRGFADLQYDSRIGGIIDIKSKNKVTQDIGFGIGSNLTHLDTYLEFPLGQNIGVIIAGRKSFTELINTPTTDQYQTRVFGSRFSGLSLEDAFDPEDLVRINNDINYQDYTAKIIADFTNSSKLTASGFLFEDGVDDETFLSSGEFLTKPFFESTVKNIFIRKNTGGGVNWKKKWKKNLSLTTNIYYTESQLKHVNDRKFFEIDNGDLEFRNKFSIENDITDFGVSLHSEWQVYKKYKILAGYDYSKISITDKLLFTTNDEDDPFPGITEKNETNAGYIENIFNITNKASLSLGMKANHFSLKNRFFLEPRLGMTFPLFKNITTNIRVERKHQIINSLPAQLLDFFFIDFPIWSLRSQLVEPVIKSDQISTDFIWNSKDWFIELGGYYKKSNGIEDLFNAIGDPFIDGFGTSRTYGADLLIKKKLDKYNTWITYSYIDQKFSYQEFENGKFFTGSFDITHNLSWIHSYLLGNFEFSLGWNFRTGKPYTPLDQETSVSSDNINGKRLQPYHRLDFSTSYRFNLSKKSKWRAKIALSFINLYDRKNILDRRVGIIEGEDTIEGAELDILSLGFTPNVSFRIDF
ncbi:TonB-dependent receptor plug domain-containing protein [Aquimarina sp. RZ0]|uniref:TonB-dependent receptor plug domain-containing protein n=1 Tax=Aquimarina sp. RZ0 TaxID=2607730 RepID=UPI0011F1C5E5|nr:TonB-dependent receptor plug domain-containing protein [Aquimarina sp. RZ0]KAA1245184.1 TonB-dependent receptor [Aquimarina sp. RZ0]